jgi:hypothetical protein
MQSSEEYDMLVALLRCSCFINLIARLSLRPHGGSIIFGQALPSHPTDFQGRFGAGTKLRPSKTVMRRTREQGKLPIRHARDNRRRVKRA